MKHTMSIHFQLDEPDQDVCFVAFETMWTWEEFDMQLDAAWAAIEGLSRPVAVLMDLTRTGHLPVGNVLGHLQRADSGMPTNVDISVMVNTPYAIINFMSIMMRIRPRVKEMTIFANSLEEGRAMIRERRTHNQATNL